MTRLTKGFTLLELIITMTIAGILIAVAAPSFSSLILNNRLIAQNNGLLTALSLGKSEALKRGLSVTLCKRNTAGTACNTTGSWQDGWLLFADQNNIGVIDTNDTIIRIYDVLSAGTTLSYELNQVTFNSLGFAENQNGSFKFCDNRGASYARGLIIANTGQLRQATDSNSDGIKEDNTATNFTCP